MTLNEVSIQAQTLLSKLNSQTTRLSNTLTQATDEIVRSSGRLAYEVELLRGEAIGLSETLGNDLKKEFEVFTSAQAEVKAMDKLTDEEPSNNEEMLAFDATLPSHHREGQPEYLSKL